MVVGTAGCDTRAVAAAMPDGALALWIAGAEGLRLRVRGEALHVEPCGAALIAATADVAAAGGGGAIVILFPHPSPRGSRRAIEPVVLGDSGVMRMLRAIGDALLHADAPLAPAEGTIAAAGVTELLGLFVPRAPDAAAGARRDETLLERVCAYVDRNLDSAISVAALCDALNISRSRLYRAAEPEGGVATLVTARRLEAAHRRLSTPGERASLRDIARAHGFADAAAFGRAYKRRFGTTPGSRRTAP
jgi:AraC-like DNA-binding protein